MMTLDQHINQNGSNAVNFICPQTQCKSLIVRKGVAQYQKSIEHLSDSNIDRYKLPELNAVEQNPQQQLEGYWMLKDAFQFENIGFSKTVTAQQDSVREGMKYLICADCEYGPLGFQDTRQTGTSCGIYLAANRVKYVQQQ
ncbi:hypothetical protein MIR68_000377 [Amoeboaphelidium protococcarum]|nr:hypothetical protein MIR68_000377 [Amoeboaphelidium protococcarum]